MRSEALAGSRIVVPLARKLVTGYIVSTSGGLPAETSLNESEIKDANQLLDVFPVINQELLQLTKWVADYYFAPWGEVIKAALPPGLSPRVEAFVSLTEFGRRSLAELAEDENRKVEFLQLISQPSETKLTELVRHFGKPQAIRLARELEREGLVEIDQRAGGSEVKTK